ncbi:uncharacterized protein LOC123207128 [Mangifera indica]|uniref:uncharacterized protein LOC123199822 n=1 Tax=Mangifera indica TaxID=29780 RepID=UPI001CFB85AF|nr:uncharacterized protein LOC123199822 [Mangifera indica]XP_044480328.1 uncharacterized protein LOC123207128 [Mangifera indica]
MTEQPASLTAPPPRQGPLLHKQHSWSPDIYRDEAWLRRKARNIKNKRSKNLTDEDLDELKACIELGFGFDTQVDQRLSDTLPALGLYYAVNKHYNDTVSKSPPSLSMASDSESSPSSLGSPHIIFSSGDDDPKTVKTRLRQWAQVVACSVRQCS